MSERECLREEEIIRAVSSGAWPDAVDAELREHALGCVTCGATVELATLLAADRATACAEARVPSAAIAWWRAEMRARQEANRAVARPIAAVVGIALASLAGLFVAVVPTAWTWLRAWAAYVADLFGAIHLPAPVGPPAVATQAAPALLSSTTVFWAGLVVCFVVAPVALYFVFTDD